MEQLSYDDRVCASWTGTGTAETITPGAAYSAGLVSFQGAFGSSSFIPRYLPLCIEAVDGSGNPTGQWQTGVWKFTPASNTLELIEHHWGSDGGGWVTFSAGEKKVWINYGSRQISGIPKAFTGDVTIYVNSSSGSDYNYGSYSQPFQSIEKALGAVAGSVIPPSVTVTIEIGDGTYTQPLVLPTFIGGGKVSLFGNPWIPGSVVLDPYDGDAISNASGCAGRYEISGVDILSSAGNGVSLKSPTADLTIGAVRFGTCAGAHIKAALGATIRTLSSTIVLTGNAVSHLHAENGAHISETCPVNVTGRAFTQYAYGADCATINAQGATYSGTATGKRYTLVGGAIIRRSGGNLPGSVAGTASATQYI